MARVVQGGAFGVIFVGLILQFPEGSPTIRSHGREGGEVGGDGVVVIT